MAKNKRKRTPKTVLKLPDLEVSRSAVLNSLPSLSSRRSYDHAIREFIDWYCSEPRLAFNRIVVTRYRMHLEQAHYSSSTINLRLAAVRGLAYEAADAGLLAASESNTIRSKRDYAIVAVLLGCGLRRAELATVSVHDLQQREEHWVFADLIGKGGHVRTIPIPHWVGTALQEWLAGAAITTGPIFRAINKAGRIPAHGFTPKVIWEVVKRAGSTCGLSNIAPHDLRRTCARLCHLAGGELEQIRFLLGHVSVQTTERYLGCKQRLHDAVNDHIGIEPD